MIINSYFDELEGDGESIDLNFSSSNFEDVDVEYLSIMHLEKMTKLKDLSLDL